MGFLDIFKAGKIKKENEQLNVQIQQLQTQLNELGGMDYFQVKETIAKMEQASLLPQIMK